MPKDRDLNYHKLPDITKNMLDTMESTALSFLNNIKCLQKIMQHQLDSSTCSADNKFLDECQTTFIEKETQDRLSQYPPAPESDKHLLLVANLNPIFPPWTLNMADKLAQNLSVDIRQLQRKLKAFEDRYKRTIPGFEADVTSFSTPHYKSADMVSLPSQQDIKLLAVSQ